MGVCGGFQMLGKIIHDPDSIEGEAGSSIGLGFLNMQTVLQKQKQLRRVSGILLAEKCAISGYEIHAGISSGIALDSPVMKLDGQMEGALSEDGQVLGTYLHGLFDQPEACNELLQWAGCTRQQAISIDSQREKGINLITDALEENFDFDKLENSLQAFTVD